ncbi:MAG: hypothetical protein K0Q48_1370 [Bacillota bacterium]|jgi:hypothetical protein|nr:hypothetical protein [Bacillota bacterium]
MKKINAAELTEYGLQKRGDLNTKLMTLSRSMESIREIIREYDTLIKQVFLKIKSVQGIANKTNLLAINASIETIHASDLLASFEQIVEKNLTIQAKIISQILAYDPDFFYQDGGAFARECGMEEFYVTDGDGIVQFTNMPSWKNSALKSSEILRILKNPELEIALPSVGNGFDGELQKTVGVARTDQPGIIQTGAHFVRPKGQLAIDGFGVVAQEAKRLADVSKEISARITTLTNELGSMLERLESIYGEADRGISACSDAASLSEAVSLEEQEARLNDLKGTLKQLDKDFDESRKYFKNILSPLTELINIARQTNLLGVRAAIEAAHSTNDKQDFDNLLNRHMTAEAKLVALLIERRPDITIDQMEELSEKIDIAEIWIADENATVELTNIKGGKGFVYQSEGQTAPFLRILSNPELIVAPPPSLRTLDNRVFKYVGVGRKDKPGFLQVGIPSKLYGESTAEGFSVVAKQIKNLAEQSRDTTTEIEAIVEDMDRKAKKAAEQMKSVQRYRTEAVHELERLK